MAVVTFFTSSPASWIIFLTVVGLLVGSFLNVVIYRLPLILQQYRQPDHRIKGNGLSLSLPASHCPHCHQKLTCLDNMPLLSYILFGGRCRYCKIRIAWHYPLVELLSAGLSALIAWHFAFSWIALTSCVLVWCLIPLAVIDLRHQILPDQITLPLMWLGIVINSFSLYTDMHSSVFGAIAGYLSLWCVFHLFRLITGKYGMGYGDFKLLAALGAWLGWQSLPTIILLSSFSGAMIGVGLLLFKRYQRDTPMPFGPYLVLAGWVVLMTGGALNPFYL